jgi:hypothetical protein
VVIMVVAPNQTAGGVWARNNGVPTVDAVTEDQPSRLADAICDSLGVANALPLIRNGAGEVVQEVMGFPSLRGPS